MGALPDAPPDSGKNPQPLADELLFGKLSDGGFVRIDWDAAKEEAVLKFKKNKAKPEAAAVDG